MNQPKQQPSLNTLSSGKEPIPNHQLQVSNGDQHSIYVQDFINKNPSNSFQPSISPNQLPLTNQETSVGLNQPQVTLNNDQTTEDNNISPRLISLNTEQQALLTERDRFQKQLMDTKAESTLLFDQALLFAKQSREKDCELDMALSKQRSDLELFRRSINEMHSSELSNGIQAGINKPGGATTGGIDEEIVLKKTDLQKLLYRIDCLKKEAESARHSQKKLETMSSSKSFLKNTGQLEGTRQSTNSNYNIHTQSPQSNRYDPVSHQQSKLLQKKLRGLEYLSPKHFIETTQELLHIQYSGRSPSPPTRQPQFSFSPSPGSNQANYNLQILQKQRSQLIASAQSQRKHPSHIQSSRSAQRLSPFRLSQGSQRSAVSPFEPLNSLPEKQQYSSQESETVTEIERTSPSLPQSSPFSHSPSGQSTRAVTASPNQTEQKQKQYHQNEIQEQFNSFGPQINSPLSQTSRPLSQLNMSPYKAGADVQQMKFSKLKNRIFLVQKHLFNSPIVQLLGGNRLIVARLFKGQITKEQSSRKLLDGNIFTFEKINMLVGQISEILRNEVLAIELLRNVSKNIFIIGTRSSQKKAIQAEFVAMIYETFYERILALSNSSYSCIIKLSFFSTVFETNPSRIIYQPFQKSINIEFNSQEDLPKVINKKLLDFKDFANQIIQVLKGSKNSTSPNKSRLNHEDMRNTRTKQNKLNICKVRTIKFSFLTLRDNEILSKQSYRMASTNNIIYPEKRNAISIFRSCFFADLVEKQISLVRRQLNTNRYTENVNSILGFKADSALRDENEFIFACAPVIKNTDISRSLFQCADVFEKLSRNSQRHESGKKEYYE